MLKLSQFQGEYFHHYLSRLLFLVDIRDSRGFDESLRDRVLCVIEGMTPETREFAKSMNKGSFAGLGVLGLWDLFSYMGYQSAEEEYYSSMFQPMKYPNLSTEDSNSVWRQICELAIQQEEANNQLFQAVKESTTMLCHIPQIDESQDASTDESANKGEEHPVDIDMESRGTSLEIEYVTLLPPFVEVIPTSPI